MAERIVIDPSTSRADRGILIFLVVFWIVWTGATLFDLWIAVSGGPWLTWVWFAFAMVGVVMIPYVLLQRRGREVIVVTDAEVRVHVEGGVRSDPWSASRRALRRLSLERYDDHGDAETVWSLNLVRDRGFLKRRLLGLTVHPDEKARAFAEIDAALRRHGFEHESVDEYSGR